MWLACYFPGLWDFQPWGRTDGAIACLAPQAGAGPLCSRDGALKTGVSLRVLGVGCPIIPASQPLSVPFLKPNTKRPLCCGGKWCWKLVSKEEGSDWETSPISVHPARRLPAPAALSFHPAGSRMLVPKWSGHRSLPNEEDDGCCLLRPACPPGIALSLALGCWGGRCLLQRSKGTGSGSGSSSCPTAVSHRDFCLPIWTCREATDRCAVILLSQQLRSQHRSLHCYPQPHAAWGFHS